MPRFPSPPSTVARVALWLGAADGLELELAHAWLTTIVPVIIAPGPAEWTKAMEGFVHGQSDRPPDAADGDPGNPRRFPRSPEWTKAMDGFGHVQPDRPPDAADGDPGNPRRFPRSPEGTKAMDGFVHGQSAGLPLAPAFPRPWVALAPCPRPGTWSTADVAAFAAAMPLVPLVAITTSLAEGSRRSGDALPGVEELPWIEVPGRVWGWVSGESRPAGGLPSTSRRDERWLAAPTRPATARATVYVAAPEVSREPVCDLLDACGFAPEPLATARPHPGCPGPVVWDAGGIGEECCRWLRLLTADGRRDIVVLESFPRGDSVRLSLDAGAAAVLPRVIAAETLAGTLGWIASRGAKRA